MKKLNIFLLFPQSDDEIYTLNGGEDEWREIVKDLKSIIDAVRNSNYTLKIFYDSYNISTFCTNAKGFTEGTYWDNARNQLLSLLRKDSIDVSKNSLYKHDCSYYRWDYSTVTCPIEKDILKSATEKFIEREEGEETIIISFLLNDSWERDIMPMIKDAPHYRNLPQLSNIPYFNPIGSFMEWHNSLINNVQFSLLNVAKFERTKYIWPRSKQRIYKERSNNRYWYYDFYHKESNEHYEVFDDNGNHIGEANCNGEVDELKKDNNKSISDIIR